MTINQLFIGTLYDASGPGNSATTTNAQMQLVPIPSSGMDSSSDGYSNAIEYENSGADVVKHPASRRVFQMDWTTRESSGANGLDIVKAMSQGLYGPGLIYVADPFNFDTNLIAPNWASPALIESGWKNIYDTTPTFVNTSTIGTNSFAHPLRSAVWSVTSSANAAPLSKNNILTLPIHPQYSLFFGWSGAVTGTGVVAIRPINLDGSYASTTFNSPLGINQLNRTSATGFPGTTYKAVEIFLTRTTTATSTVSISGMMARQVQNSPVAAPSMNVTGNHVPGQGFTGLKFNGPAVVEKYIQAPRGQQIHLKGMSVDLVETGAWTNY